MPTQTPQETLARNARRLRGDETMASVADRARALGATWSSGTIGGIEAGRAKVTVETLVLLAVALETTVDELLTTEGGVAITDELILRPGSLLRVLAGGPVEPTRALNVPPPVAQPTSTERRVAAALGIDPETLQEIAQRLWSRSYEAERNGRAGEGATRQAKAATTRELQAEIREELDRG